MSAILFDVAHDTFLPHSTVHVRFLLPTCSHDLEFKEFHHYISPIMRNVRCIGRCPLVHLHLHSVRGRHVLKSKSPGKLMSIYPFWFVLLNLCENKKSWLNSLYLYIEITLVH